MPSEANLCGTRAAIGRLSGYADLCRALLVLARTRASRFGAIHLGWGGAQGRAAGSALARDELARTDGNVEAGEHLFGHEQRAEDDGAFALSTSGGEAVG